MGIPPTGKQVTTSATVVSRFAGGQWAEDWANIDTLGMLQQIGASPAPGAAQGSLSNRCCRPGDWRLEIGHGVPISNLYLLTTCSIVAHAPALPA